MCNPNCPRAKPLIKHQLTKEPLPLHTAPCQVVLTVFSLHLTLHLICTAFHCTVQCHTLGAVNYSAGVYPDSI